MAHLTFNDFQKQDLKFDIAKLKDATNHVLKLTKVGSKMILQVTKKPSLIK